MLEWISSSFFLFLMKFLFAFVSINDWALLRYSPVANHKILHYILKFKEIEDDKNFTVSGSYCVYINKWINEQMNKWINAWLVEEKLTAYSVAEYVASISEFPSLIGKTWHNRGIITLTKFLPIRWR